MLNIKKLSVSSQGTPILNNINLTIKTGEIHLIMGPNGMGKSTICKTIIGDPNYVITNGTIKYNNNDLSKLDVTQRANLGIYEIFQYPIEIEGVTNAEMLRTALNSKNKTNISIYEFNKKMENICQELNIPKSFIHRGINYSMSGGEKKKNELLHMWILEPSLIILDEIDSGLDIDSIKLVGKSLKKYFDTHDCGVILISHNINITKYLKPNFVHILNNGTIVETGDYNLAKKIEKNGYSSTFNISKDKKNE